MKSRLFTALASAVFMVVTGASALAAADHSRMSESAFEAATQAQREARRNTPAQAGTIEAGGGLVGGSGTKVTRVSPRNLRQATAIPIADKPYRSFEKDLSKAYTAEAGLSGSYIFIVRYEDASLALYKGGVKGLKATSPASKRGAGNVQRKGGRAPKLDAKSADSISYLSYLAGKQAGMMADISARVGAVYHVRSYRHALNAAALRMTPQQAEKVALMNGVKSVTRDVAMELDTDFGPPLIGAPNIWDGSATGMEARGEGMTIGVIDTGINFNAVIDGETVPHPSFAATDEEGFTHTNPLGDGVFLGGCIDNPEWCNAKLIGVHSNLDAQAACVGGSGNGGCDQFAPNADPIWDFKDTDGHGSHTASTTAGNALLDLPIFDADGEPNFDFTVPRISGVAHRANIVTFKVCATGCFFSDIVAATDTMIADGVVDALNHSIGSSSGSPWGTPQGEAWKAARAAGIYVATSAGNSGPTPGTAARANCAPWASCTAASTHDREFPPKTINTFSGGDALPPEDMYSGAAITGGITGAVYWAGDFPTADGSNNDTQPEQCLDPFPTDHFPPDSIILCDRGAIARVAKAQNVRDGGAAGFILGNIDGGATSVVADPHVIPAIHVDAASANDLRAWLASGGGHMATIDPGDPAVSNLALADIMAGFSSRGPYTDFEWLAPSYSAPGVNILAAGAQVLFDHQGTGNDVPSVAALFGIISGTSMASPHAAGSSLLVKQTRPGWTDAEVLSAMMLTGTPDVLKEDGATPADAFDIGGGRIQVDVAAQSTLIMDESIANFDAADPASGGDPSTLNVASLVSNQCVQGCDWTRTVTATTDGTWTVTSDGGLLSADPSEFTLAPGEEQLLTVTADVIGQDSGEFVFDALRMTHDGGGPDAVMQAAIIPSNGEFPSSIVIPAGRDQDSWLVEDLTAIDITNFSTMNHGLNVAVQHDLALPQDSNNGDPFDGDAGTTVVFFDVPAGTQFTVSEITVSESPDLDLFVGADFNLDGIATPDELVCVSATGIALERCVVELGGGLGDFVFWSLVQNWQASDPDAVDAFTLANTVVGGDQGNFFVEGPVGALPALTPFDIRVFWDVAMSDGDIAYGRFIMDASGDFDEASLIGAVDVRVDRNPDDVLLSASTDTAAVGDVVDISLAIQANSTPESRSYLISVPIPDDTSVVPGSISGGGVQFGNMILWDVTQPSLLKTEGVYVISTDDDTRGDFSALCDTGFGGFLDLGPDGLDFGTLGISGDDDAFITLASETYDFYGKAHPGGLVVDLNGYISFDAANHSFFSHGPIPDTFLPNGMIATHFIDQIINDDGVSGFRAASIPGTVGIVQVDGAQDWTGAGGGDDRYKYQTVIYNNQDAVFPEIIMAYGPQDYTGTDDGGFPGLFGIENETGTAGSMFAFDNPGNAIYDGLQVCFDFVGPSANPMIAGFQLEIGDGASGSVVTVHEADVVDSPGSGEATSSADITVGALNHVFSGFLHPIYEGAQYNRRSFVNTVFGLPFRFRIFDAVTGELVSDGVHAWQVYNAAGELIADGEFEFNPWAADWRFRMDTTDADLGFITVVALLDDGTEHSVSIEFIDGDRFGGGFPGF